MNRLRGPWELEHANITSVLTSFKDAYETWWHAILKVRLGLPVDHDPLSTTPICWRHCCITVAGKTWEEACRGFEAGGNGARAETVFFDPLDRKVCRFPKSPLK